MILMNSEELRHFIIYGQTIKIKNKITLEWSLKIVWRICRILEYKKAEDGCNNGWNKMFGYVIC